MHFYNRKIIICIYLPFYFSYSFRDSCASQRFIFPAQVSTIKQRKNYKYFLLKIRLKFLPIWIIVFLYLIIKMQIEATVQLRTHILFVFITVYSILHFLVNSRKNSTPNLPRRNQKQNGGYCYERKNAKKAVESSIVSNSGYHWTGNVNSFCCGRICSNRTVCL